MTDDTPALQEAIDANPCYTIPAGRYVLESQLVIPPNHTVRSCGRVWRPTPSQGVTGGVIFEVRFGSGAGASGNAANAAVRLRSGASIDGVGFDYPDQTPNLSAPIEFGPSILFADPESSGNWDQKASNIYLNKSYHGIDVRGSMSGLGVAGAIIKGIRGAPLKAGILMDMVNDWSVLDQIQFNSGYLNPVAGDVGDLRRWVACEGVMVRLGGNDWITVDRLQGWGYRVGAQLVARENYVASGPFVLRNSQIDGTLIGVDIWPGAGAYDYDIDIVGNRFASFNPYTGAWGAPVVINGAVAGRGLNYLNNYAFCPYLAGIILGTSATMMRWRVQGNSCDTSTGAVALQLGAGLTQLGNNDFRGLI